jgi:5,10-methenyltetrahydromethanopterin hydrogenase
MTDDVDRLQRQITHLQAQTLALEALFVGVVSELMASGGLSQAVVRNALDNAADIVTATQMKLGDRAEVGHTGGAAQIVDKLRAAILKD